MEGPLGGFINRVGGIEPGNFHLLIAKGLGSADAGKTGLDFRIDVSRFLLHPYRNSGKVRSHSHNHRNENGHQNSHHQSKLPSDGRHNDQRADDRHRRSQQVLRAVVGKLRQLKQIRSQAAHQLARAVFIVKIVTQLLHMPKQICPDIRLYPDAEGVAKITNNVV